ncbi:glycosyltransferase [Sphaerotilaceae bacterium SBD11-9]
MNILHLTKFYAPVTGGIETVVLELAQGMRRQGLKVDVLCAGTERRTCHDRTAEGITVTRAGSLGKLLSTSMSPALMVQARRLVPSYDLVHVHMPDPMAALALWAAQPKAKVVVHWHSDVVRQNLAMRVYQPLQHWLLRRADAIIATSEPYAKSSVWLRPWQDKTVVVPIGISDHFGSPQPELTRQIQDRFGGRDIVFALGRMTYYKGFDVLIEAAAALAPHCVIVVGGEGELLEGHRAEVVRRGLSERIHFVGAIPACELSAYFAAASMFCLTSTHRAEAYGVVLLEAMASGKPVIATHIEGSAASWINQSGTTGLNVPASDVSALVEAVNRISTDKAFSAQLGRAARARYESSFSADVMVHSTMGLYARLLARNPASTSPPGRANQTRQEQLFGNDR